jgi:hypothetical protein
VLEVSERQACWLSVRHDFFRLSGHSLRKLGLQEARFELLYGECKHKRYPVRASFPPEN